MDHLPAARGAIVCFRFDFVELRRCCTLQWRLAATIIIIIIIIIIIEVFADMHYLLQSPFYNNQIV